MSASMDTKAWTVNHGPGSGTLLSLDSKFTGSPSIFYTHGPTDPNQAQEAQAKMDL